MTLSASRPSDNCSIRARSSDYDAGARDLIDNGRDKESALQDQKTLHTRSQAVPVRDFACRH
jgi:hypothetical protein